MKIRKVVIWGIGGVVAVGAVFGVFAMSHMNGSESGESVVLEDGFMDDPEIVEVSGRMLMMGNIFWGRRMNTWARASELGVAYPFSGLYTFEREKYTDWIAGLECPTVDRGGAHSEYEEETLLKFNCDPDYLPEAAKWFSMLSLGNNHTDNQGEEGFYETQDELNKNSIQFFGHYDYRNATDVCNVVKVTTVVKYDDGVTESQGLPMAFCGYNGVFGVPTEESLAQIKRYAEVMPVVVMAHMGAEYQPKADELRMNLYRKMIDYGAEMVIGDHPHWVQNSEVYNDKLIVYSLGNFMFDQQSNSEVTRSAVVDASFKVSVADAAGWGEIARECVGDLEGCRVLANEMGLSRYPVSWEFEMLASDDSGKLTKKAGEDITRGVLERLNWAETARGLKNE
jgi:poly-gamma-glutamate synthesis protein (capsule biosynthesis protein)